MDGEFRTALRNLQRAGGSFSQLDLHSCLDLAQINDLIHHCLLAKMQHLGFQVAQETLTPRLPLLGTSLTVLGQDMALQLDNRPKGPTSRKFREHAAFLEMYLPEDAAKQREVQTLNDLPRSVVQRISECWHVVETNSRKSIWHPAGETILLKRIGIEVYFYADRWILAFVWEEMRS